MMLNEILHNKMKIYRLKQNFRVCKQNATALNKNKFFSVWVHLSMNKVHFLYLNLL